MDDQLAYLDRLVMFAAGIAILSLAIVILDYLCDHRPNNRQESHDA